MFSSTIFLLKLPDSSFITSITYITIVAALVIVNIPLYQHQWNVSLISAMTAGQWLLVNDCWPMTAGQCLSVFHLVMTWRKQVASSISSSGRASSSLRVVFSHIKGASVAGPKTLRATQRLWTRRLIGRHRCLLWFNKWQLLLDTRHHSGCWSDYLRRV